ncbi:hypothetical protein [Campylobacter geochelonis]|uniref:hypothetical protein n=1 Tax=Campylobacter geochelonis TaxID=1780362 RepID=UPI000770A310|nr:hypothetical protein [Campylobacter geochelonis]CZE50537.1 Uncharacterised protein [Campylobacter geochelonis]
MLYEISATSVIMALIYLCYAYIKDTRLAVKESELQRFVDKANRGEELFLDDFPNLSKDDIKKYIDPNAKFHELKDNSSVTNLSQYKDNIIKNALNNRKFGI